MDDSVTQADRDTAWVIARFFLGNADPLPDDIRSGKVQRHFILDVMRNQRLYGQGSLPNIRKDTTDKRMEALDNIANLPWASGRDDIADACSEMQQIARNALTPRPTRGGREG